MASFFNTFGSDYRGDVAAVGEIAPTSGPTSSDGDVFVIGTIKNNSLFLLMRKIAGPWYAHDDSTGVMVEVNDCVWAQGGVAYYLKDMVNDSTTSGIPSVSSQWATDYYKWKYTDGQTQGIQFYMYSDPAGTKPATVLNGSQVITNPTLEFGIVERGFDICTEIHGKKNKSGHSYFFQPRFRGSSGGFVSINDNPYYIGKDNTGIQPVCQKDGNTSPTGPQVVTGARYNGVLSATNPGLDLNLTSNSSLYAGTIYNTNVTPKGNYLGNENVKNSDLHKICMKSQLFGRETYFFAYSGLVSSGPYKALSYGMDTDEKDDPEETDTVSNRFYYGGSKSKVSCDASSHYYTYTTSDYQGFSFFLIPVKYFLKDTCNQVATNSIINSNCAPFYKRLGSDSSRYDWFLNYCANGSALKVQTGYVDYLECLNNQGSQPYLYPEFCWDGNGNVVNGNCGEGYGLNIGCSSLPSVGYIGPVDIYGTQRTTTSSGQSMSTAKTFNPLNPPANCCIRQNGNPPAPTTNCYDFTPCNPDGGPPGCIWQSPSGEWICTSQGYPQGCVTMCTQPFQPSCTVYPCTDTFTLEGCVSSCDANGSPPGCSYEYNGQWICNSPGSGYPSGCLEACNSLSPSAQSQCTTIPCTGSPTDYPGCYPVCDGTNSDFCWEMYNGTFICQRGVINNPPGCQYLCSDVNTQGCITPDCSILDVPGCVTPCTSPLEDPIADGCQHSNGSGGWICNGDASDPPGCTPVCDGTNSSNCYLAYCTDINVPGCIAECTGVNDPPGCYYKDHNNTQPDGWWICENTSTAFPPGCVNVCSPTGTTNCKRVTCASPGGVQIPGCWNQVSECADGNYSACYYPTTKNGSTEVCYSVNNPPGCVMQCTGANTTPTWGEPTTCTTVNCYDGSSPPGCTAGGGGGGGGGSGGGGGVPLWVWIIVGIIGFIVIAVIGFMAYHYSSTATDEEEELIKPPPASATAGRPSKVLQLHEQ